MNRGLVCCLCFIVFVGVYADSLNAEPPNERARDFVAALGNAETALNVNKEHNDAFDDLSASTHEEDDTDRKTSDPDVDPDTVDVNGPIYAEQDELSNMLGDMVKSDEAEIHQEEDNPVGLENNVPPAPQDFLAP